MRSKGKVTYLTGEEVRMLKIVGTLFKRQQVFAKWIGIKPSTLVYMKQSGLAIEPNARRVRVMLKHGFGDLPGQIKPNLLKAAEKVWEAQEATSSEEFGTLEADVVSIGEGREI